MSSALLTRRRTLALAAASWLAASAQAAPVTPAGPAAPRRKHAPSRKTAQKPAPPEAPAYAGHPAAEAFALAVAARRGLDADTLLAQLARARRIDAVRQLVMPPPAGTAKNWAAYRSRFVEPQRIAAGTTFWREHERRLAEAEARWGVPAAIVVAIIGVETFYGRHTGNFRLIDALATLSFDFPAGRRDRSDFFRSELEEFFVLCAREGRDPQSVKGSYAGAMGLPQFMPGSVNRWALDFDGDGHIDLLGSPADAIGSVAHYLAAFGWRRDLATHHAVAAPVDASDRAALLAPDILPSFTAAQFTERGAELDAAGRQHTGLLALVELQNGERAPSFVAGTGNFYAITRYNWSSYYAMAVIELAQALREAR
ncbi:MAG: lytic murein transglycosylase B [Rubrivivax sp.]|nr:lytic murein transglycosylase B [Rubrivivax sp.]